MQIKTVPLHKRLGEKEIVQNSEVEITTFEEAVLEIPKFEIPKFENIVAQMKAIAQVRLADKQFQCFVLLVDKLLKESNTFVNEKKQTDSLINQLNVLEDYLDACLNVNPKASLQSTTYREADE